MGRVVVRPVKSWGPSPWGRGFGRRINVWHAHTGQLPVGSVRHSGTVFTAVGIDNKAWLGICLLLALSDMGRRAANVRPGVKRRPREGAREPTSEPTYGLGGFGGVLGILSEAPGVKSTT